MTGTTPEQNNALGLEAFDTLFNGVITKPLPASYIQHSAYIEPDRDGLFD